MSQEEQLAITISGPETPHLKDLFNTFFGEYAGLVEHTKYLAASTISRNYSGGNWETYTIEYGASKIPLRLLDSDQQFLWVNTGLHAQGATDAKTFSAAVSCFTYSHLSFAAADEGLSDFAQKLSMAYHHTRAAVYQNETMFNTEAFTLILD